MKIITEQQSNLDFPNVDVEKGQSTAKDRKETTEESDSFLESSSQALWGYMLGLNDIMHRFSLSALHAEQLRPVLRNGK